MHSNQFISDYLRKRALRVQHRYPRYPVSPPMPSLQLSSSKKEEMFTPELSKASWAKSEKIKV